MAVIISVGGVLAVPTLGIEYLTYQTVGETPLFGLPLYVSVPIAALQVLANSVLMPFTGLLFTFFYFDLRVRFEGFGLAGESA